MIRGTPISMENDVLLLIAKINEEIGYNLADRIIIYSENLVDKWNLERYRQNFPRPRALPRFRRLHRCNNLVRPPSPHRLHRPTKQGEGVQRFARFLPAFLGDQHFAGV